MKKQLQYFWQECALIKCFMKNKRILDNGSIRYLLNGLKIMQIILKTMKRLSVCHKICEDYHKWSII